MNACRLVEVTPGFRPNAFLQSPIGHITVTLPSDWHRLQLPSVQTQVLQVGKEAGKKKWRRALYQAQRNQQKYGTIQEYAVYMVKCEMIHKDEQSGKPPMTLYCSLHFPRLGKDELQVLGVKTAPPLAAVKWEPYALRLPAKHKSVWRPRTLGAAMSTMPASHPTSHTHSLGKSRMNFVTAFIPVNNPHNEKPRSFSFLLL